MRIMQCFHNTHIRLVVFVIFLLAINNADGAIETFRSRQEGENVTIGTKLSVTDDKFEYMKANPSWFNLSTFFHKRIDNRVTLSINPYGTALMNQPFTVTVSIEVVTSRWDATTSHFVSETRTETLQVNYTLAGPYTDKNTFFTSNGGNDMTITVLDFYTTPSNLGFVPSIALEGEIEVERFYKFEFNTPIDESAMRIDASAVDTRNELIVNWDAVRGAEEYDLEWAYVNNLDRDGNEIAMADLTLDPDIFRLNSTRITTANTSYHIPLTFEPGYIVFRMRPVGRDPDSNYTQIFPGTWSKDPLTCSSLNLVSCMGTHAYLYRGLSTSFNWQSSIEFIEGGKNKVNISYHDATLRNRQTLTRLNSIDAVLVGETIYDKSGRAVISTLPVPFAKTDVFYSFNFNRNVKGDAYSAADFDADCIPAPPPMSTQVAANNSTGSANYYSSQNKNKVNQQAYLPDAGGYAFIQKRFTLDNTGRISSQSGVGKDHKLGSGHESKYFYGTPFQEELDRLFGLDVGFAEHYKKDMAIDANGQVSVTYIDSQGKTVATALAGTPPTIVDPLDGVEDRQLTIDLLTKTNPSDQSSPMEVVSLDGMSKSFSRNYLATAQGPRNFHYDLGLSTFQPQCEFPDGAEKKCYNCVVNVTVSVKDECGNEIFPTLDDANARTKTVGTISECKDPVGSYTTGTSDKYNVNMNVGSYQVSKTISIDQQALNAYTANFMDSLTNSCIKTFENFFDDEILKVDISGCNITCKDCQTRVGVFPSWDLNDYNINHNPNCNQPNNKPCLSEEQYIKLLSSCDVLCKNEAVNCDVGLIGMLADVSPFGQYGGVLSNDAPMISSTGVLDQATLTSTEFDPSKYPLSIFNTGNDLPQHFPNTKGTSDGRPNWKNPRHYLNADSKHYFDENNSVEYVKVLVLAPEENSTEKRFLPTIDDDAKPTDDPAVGTTILVEPQHLKEVNDFIANWKSSWAESMVQYHPEYVYYQICLASQASNEFDVTWLAADSVDKARTAFGFGSDTTNLPNPLGSNASVALDPYFNSDLSINSRFKGWEYASMKYRMEHYKTDPTIGDITIWEAAHVAANCPEAGATSTSCPICVDSFDGINTDAEWIQFRSFYLSLKQSFQAYKTRIEAINKFSYNGCIGVEAFDPSTLNSYDPQTGTFLFYNYLSSSYYNAQQTCYFGRYAKFKNKTKRFPSAVDLTGLKDKNNSCYQNIDVTYNEANGTTTNFHLPSTDELATCTEDDKNTIKKAKEKADRIIFETCGQCPLARDVQFLLDAVAREDRDGKGNIIKKSQLVLTNADINTTIDPIKPAFYLSCFPTQSSYKELTAQLEDSMKLPGNGVLFWKQNSVTDHKLNASIQRKGESNKCDIVLAMPDDALYSLSDLRGMCCLHYDGNPKLLPLQLGHNFKIEGIVQTTSTTDGTTQYVKVEMEGTSCVDINTCPMPPVCTLTPQAEALESLFDALVAESTSASPKFVTNGGTVDIFSSTPGTNEPYGSIIRGVLDKPTEGALDAENWVWSSTAQSPTQLRGTIKDKNSDLSIFIDLFLAPDADFTFSEITSIESITSDNVNENPEQDFTLSVLVQHNGSTKSAIIKGYSSSYKIASCRPVSATADGSIINN